MFLVSGCWFLGTERSQSAGCGFLLTGTIFLVPGFKGGFGNELQLQFPMILKLEPPKLETRNLKQETLTTVYCASVNLSEIPALVFEVGTCENTCGLLIV